MLNAYVSVALRIQAAKATAKVSKRAARLALGKRQAPWLAWSKEKSWLKPAFTPDRCETCELQDKDLQRAPSSYSMPTPFALKFCIVAGTKTNGRSALCAKISFGTDLNANSSSNLQITLPELSFNQAPFSDSFGTSVSTLGVLEITLQSSSPTTPLTEPALTVGQYESQNISSQQLNTGLSAQDTASGLGQLLKQLLNKQTPLSNSLLEPIPKVAPQPDAAQALPVIPLQHTEPVRQCFAQVTPSCLGFDQPLPHQQEQTISDTVEPEVLDSSMQEVFAWFVKCCIGPYFLTMRQFFGTAKGICPKRARRKRDVFVAADPKVIGRYARQLYLSNKKHSLMLNDQASSGKK